MKYLIVIVVVGLAIAWLMRGRQRVVHRDGERKERTVDMVRCAHCGVHLPAADALGDGVHRFCSDDHRRAGAR